MSEESGAAKAGEYWFNTSTGQVEEGRQSGWSDLMGPYGSRAEAEHALDRARRRTEAWDQQDDAWSSGDDAAPGAD